MGSKLYLIVCLSILIAGCEGNLFHSDITPPTAPRGIYTETGDNLVEVFWIDNPEADVAGYNVFVGSSYSGMYTLVASTSQPHFVDYGANNGVTYYYAVTAYDFSGNESELSRDVAYDTPRPEGYDIHLNDYRTRPDLSGYDFSTYSVGPYNDRYTDVFFEYFGGSYYMNVWEDSDIQDMGYTISLYEIRFAPTNGWSPTKDVRLIVGHTYVVWTWDNHFAKFRITALSPARVIFDWTYQLQAGNTRLRPSPSSERILEPGSGARSRQSLSRRSLAVTR